MIIETIKRKYTVESTLTGNKVCQLLSDGNVNDLSLTYNLTNVLGDTTSINTYENISTVLLNANNVLICYSGTSNFLYASIITISGSVGSQTFNVGNPVQINNVNTILNKITVLSSGNILVTYLSGTTLSSVVLTISSNNIVVGTIQNITTSSGTSFDIKLLNTTTVFVCYNNSSSGYLYYSILTIGTSISVGTLTAINSVVSSQIRLTLIGKSVVIVSYVNSSGNLHIIKLIYLNSIIDIMNDNQIGTYVVTSYDIIKFNYSALMVVISCSTGIISYKVYTNGISNTVTTTSTLSSVVGSNVTFTIISSNYAYLSFINTTNNYIYNYIVKISSSSLSSVVNINSVSSNNNVIVLNNTYIVLLYQDSSNILHLNLLQYLIGNYIGISQDSNGTVILKGIVKNFSNLTVGQNYYYNNGSGSIVSVGISSSYIYCGIAISPTELYITDYITN